MLRVNDSILPQADTKLTRSVIHLSVRKVCSDSPTAKHFTTYVVGLHFVGARKAYACTG